MSYAYSHALNMVESLEKLKKMSSAYTGRLTDEYEPEDVDSCLTLLRANGREIGGNDNIIAQKLVMTVREELFYRSYLFNKKTYIVDTEFFDSLAKAEDVKIYPSILKTIKFKSYALDLRGSNLFNGYIYCNIDANDTGVFCSFLACNEDNEEDNKQFNIHI